jgi:hypothetical protein
MDMGFCQHHLRNVTFLEIRRSHRAADRRNPRPGLRILLQCQSGNIFVYSSSKIENYYDHIDELGGVSVVLLNHRDEATPHVTTLSNHYNAPVRAHQADVDACTQRGVESITALTESETHLGDDLVAIHTPGTTPGSSAISGPIPPMTAATCSPATRSPSSPSTTLPRCSASTPIPETPTTSANPHDPRRTPLRCTRARPRQRDHPRLSMDQRRAAGRPRRGSQPTRRNLSHTTGRPRTGARKP